jgi:hypothetical protein
VLARERPASLGRDQQRLSAPGTATSAFARPTCARCSSTDQESYLPTPSGHDRNPTWRSSVASPATGLPRNWLCMSLPPRIPNVRVRPTEASQFAGCRIDQPAANRGGESVSHARSASNSLTRAASDRLDIQPIGRIITLVTLPRHVERSAPWPTAAPGPAPGPRRRACVHEAA